MEIKLKHLYRHFKGNLYYVEDLALDSETMKEVVVYRALYGSFGLFVRDKEMFLSKVDKIKYPDVNQIYRFELVGEGDE